MIDKTCMRCGAAFQVHDYREKTARFCSRRCARRSQNGPSAGGWRGGVGKHSGGYQTIWVAPNTAHRYAHRIAAEKMLGRTLTSREVVHHKNGNKTDNRPENLQVMTQSEHARLHAEQQR